MPVSRPRVRDLGGATPGAVLHESAVRSEVSGVKSPKSLVSRPTIGLFLVTGNGSPRVGCCRVLLEQGCARGSSALSPRTSGQIVHDTLRFSEGERDEIISLLTKSPAGPGSLNARCSLPAEWLEVQLKQLAGPSAWFRVWPHDISQTGIGFIHGAFVHPGVQCGVALQALNGDRVMVAATVARCEHVKGRAHFVGVRFEEPLPLHRFVPGVEPPPEKPDARGANGGPKTASVQEIKGLVGQLVSLSSSKECPAPIRKLARQIAEAIGSLK